MSLHGADPYAVVTARVKISPFIQRTQRWKIFRSNGEASGSTLQRSSGIPDVCWLRQRLLTQWGLLRRQHSRQRWQFWKPWKRTYQGHPWSRGTCSHRSCWRSCKLWKLSCRWSSVWPRWLVWGSPHLLLGSYYIKIYYSAMYLLNNSLVNKSRLLFGTTEHVDHIFHWHDWRLLKLKLIFNTILIQFKGLIHTPIFICRSQY